MTLCTKDLSLLRDESRLKLNGLELSLKHRMLFLSTYLRSPLEHLKRPWPYAHQAIIKQMAILFKAL
jgi:hypothetical protein